MRLLCNRERIAAEYCSDIPVRSAAAYRCNRTTSEGSVHWPVTSVATHVAGPGQVRRGRRFRYRHGQHPAGGLQARAVKLYATGMTPDSGCPVAPRPPERRSAFKWPGRFEMRHSPGALWLRRVVGRDVGPDDVPRCGHGGASTTGAMAGRAPTIAPPAAVTDVVRCTKMTSACTPMLPVPAACYCAHHTPTANPRETP